MKFHTLGQSNQALKKVTTVYTEKIQLHSIQKSGKIAAKLVLDPASLKLAPGINDTVIVEYAIKDQEKNP